MNGLQRGIKYGATAFAIFLAVTIIAAIVGAGATVINVIGGGSFGSGVVRDFDQNYGQDIRKISIDGGVYDLKVKSGDEVKVEMRGVSETYTAKQSGSHLKISGKSNLFGNLFNGRWDDENYGKGEITLYLPDGLELDEFKVDAGLGSIEIETLNTRYLNIDSGAGDITSQEIKAAEVDIDGGMGNVMLDGAALGDVDLDGGMGNVEINGELYGDSDFDLGMGNIELDLRGSIEDYNIKADNGPGEIKINGQSYKEIKWDDSQAKYNMDIDGGMGNIEIRFDN